MTPGLYGKLPAHGDFVRRALPADLVNAWDGWVAEGLLAARAQLGDEGFDIAWDAMPCWCFSLPAGVCGAEPVSGVMAPSRDAVGRRFPLLLAVPEAAPGEAWFATLEALAAEAVAGQADLAAIPSHLPPAEGRQDIQGWWNAALEWPVPSLPPPRHFVRFLGHAPA